MEIFINEEESLLLIKALENLEYNNYEKINNKYKFDMLLAKIIYMSLDYGKTLEGKTVEDIYEEIS